MIKLEGYMTPYEAAAECLTDVDNVMDLIRHGELSAVTIDGSTFIRAEDLKDPRVRMHLWGV